MPVKGIILVEPGVHLERGHYREKLNLWVEAFRRAGWTVTVACFEAPPPNFLSQVAFRSAAPRWKRLGNLVPRQIRTPWVVFRAFCLGFCYGKQTGSPVFGLTTSTLFPVATARLFSNARAILFAQILMYGNVFDSTVPRLKRMLEQVSLYSLLESGAVIFPNTERTRNSLLSNVNGVKFCDRIVTLYDPIYIPRRPIPLIEKLGEGILLVPGPDDRRRSPLLHLAHSKLIDPPKTLWIHAPGQKEDEILQIREIHLEFAPEIHVFTDHRDVEAFAQLFASASWCLIAYDPVLFQGSGLLAQAIAGGTPVLCSRFAHAEELFSQFGRLGELFTFGDLDDFRNAWSKLRNWSFDQWKEFKEASSRFTEAVNADCTTRKVIEYFTGV